VARINERHGGARAGAGRKSKAEELGIAALWDKAWPLTARIEVVKALHKQAKQGNVQASALLLAYGYGKPAEKYEHGGEGGGPIILKVVYEK